MKSKFKIHKLSEFITEVSVRNNKKQVGEVFSVTNSEGFIKSTDYFDKEVFSKNISNYKVVSKYQFAYNPSRINVGSISFLKEDFEVAISPLYVVFECNKNLLPDYLLRFLKSPVGIRQIRNKTRGAVRDTLTFKSLSEINLPIPSVQQQQKICLLLSKIDDLIEKRINSLGLIKKLSDGLFHKIFGDPEKNQKDFQVTSLENLCAEIVDCPHSTPIKSHEITNFPCIRTSELNDGYISWKSMQYLDEEEYEKRTRRLIPVEGDIVYGREGTYGEAIRIPGTHKFSLGQRTMLFRPDYKKTTSIFLWAMVRSNFVYRQAQKKNNRSTVGHINVKDIKQFRILNPPLLLQTQFSKTIEKAEILRGQLKSSLNDLENLYSSLSQRAFKGDLDLSKVDLDHIIPVSNEGNDSDRNIDIVPREVNISIGNKKVSVLKTVINSHFKNRAFNYQELADKIQENLIESEYDYNKIKNEVFNSLKGKGDIRLKQLFNEKDKTILLQRVK